MSSTPFGRRREPLRQFSRAVSPVHAFAQGTRAETPEGSLPQPGQPVKTLEFLSFDDDFEQWKLARKRNFELPWRSLSLLASLFFGVASLALPDSVNDVVQWALYALAAASLWAGFRRRRRRAKI